MNANSAHWFILVIINIPVYLAIGKLIFKDWGSFLEAVRLWSTVDWWYSLEKQWHEDRKGTSELHSDLRLPVGGEYIDDAVDGLRGIRGVEGGEDEVAGFRRS